jgi:hypothetical protein
MPRIVRLLSGTALIIVWSVVGSVHGEPAAVSRDGLQSPTAKGRETTKPKPSRQSPRRVEHVEVRADGGSPRQVEGVVIVEAVDGGLLLEREDERLELVQPDQIISRTPVPRPDVESPRDLGRRILGELPPGFDLLVTRHYCICFDTSRAYAQWCAALFERLHDAFANFWKQAGLEISPPPRPLVVVIFADRQRYEAFAARDLGGATDRVVGYYNLMTNRVTTFDLTGSAGLVRPVGQAAAGAGLEILGTPEASGMVATLVHEATHQMAFNGGLHQRLAPVPLWLSEGVATYFETPDLASDRGWKGIGNVNTPRLDRFLKGQRAGAIEQIVLSDDPFRSPDEAIDAYSRAWALTFFLMQTRKAAFVDYLRTIARKEPLTDDSPEERLRDFTTAFGATPAALEDQVLKHMTRLRPGPR